MLPSGPVRGFFRNLLAPQTSTFLKLWDIRGARSRSKELHLRRRTNQTRWMLATELVGTGKRYKSKLDFVVREACGQECRPQTSAHLNKLTSTPLRLAIGTITRVEIRLLFLTVALQTKKAVTTADTCHGQIMPFQPACEFQPKRRHPQFGRLPRGSFRPHPDATP